MRPEKQGNESIHDEADPEIDQQTKVWPQSKAVMPGSGRQVWHQQKVDGVTQHHRREGDREVSRETHSPHLDTRTTRAGFQRSILEKANQEFMARGPRSCSNHKPDSVDPRNYSPAQAVRSGFARSMSFMSDWS